NLRVIFDSCLSFNVQVTKVVQSCFFQLRLIFKVRPFLSFSDLEKVIHAFITSRLNYCNALYSGISKGNIHRLHLIQNSAARLLTHSRRSDHIQFLQAFTGYQLVLELILLFVFKAIHGQVPIYICDLLTFYEPDCCLRSSDRNLLIVPECRLLPKVIGPLLFVPLSCGIPC
ncbi:hypothetical protein LDENG_00076430, partial [Lucifuga dentata]